MIRPTQRGKLYTLLSAGTPGPVKLTTSHSSVIFGLDKYGLLEESPGGGITLIEAAGDVIIAGKDVFRIQAGRAIISSEDGLPLDTCSRVRIVATEPTQIRFSKRIRSAAALEPGATKPLGDVPEASGQFELKIESELLRYPTRIEFSKE